jgi:hypothetical protein
MTARKNDVPPPAPANKRGPRAKGKPDGPAPVPEAQDNRGVGLSGG